jgi:hypothetical protein
MLDPGIKRLARKTSRDIMLNEAVHSSRRQVLDLATISLIVSFATDLFHQEKDTLTLAGQCVIVGNIHENIGVLLRIFEKMDYPRATSYLFLADYVDRGEHSFEVIVLLYSLKIIAPNSLHLLRGNHEFAMINEMYGFGRECERHWSPGLYEQIVDSFRSLPISGIFGSTFCVHGGIAPSLRSRQSRSRTEMSEQTL